MLFDSIQNQLTSMSYADLSLRESMQFVSNMWALGKGLNAIDEWTMRHFMGITAADEAANAVARRPSSATSFASTPTLNFRFTLRSGHSRQQ